MGTNSARRCAAAAVLLAASLGTSAAAAAPPANQYFLQGFELSVTTGELTAVEFAECHLEDGLRIELEMDAALRQDRPVEPATARHLRAPTDCADGKQELRTVVDTDGTFLPDFGLPVSELEVDVTWRTCFVRTDPEGEESRTCIRLRSSSFDYDIDLVP